MSLILVSAFTHTSVFFLGNYQSLFWSLLFPRFLIFNRKNTALDNFLHSPHGQPWRELVAWTKVQCAVCSKYMWVTSNFKSSVSLHASLNDGLASCAFVHWNISSVEDWHRMCVLRITSPCFPKLVHFPLSPVTL